MIKLGVFDSGIGGLSVAKAIQKALPSLDVVFMNDSKNVPYGSRSSQQLLTLVKPILDHMIADGCEVIVIACNTVTTTLIDELRKYSPVTLIGIEPMVKPAAELTTTKVIAVCATPTTLKSERYASLKNRYASDLKVLEPDCSDWSYMIETNRIDHQRIEKRIVEVCEKGADVIVLGCTHYHWIAEEIKGIAEKYKAKVIFPEQAVVQQVMRVLKLHA